VPDPDYTSIGDHVGTVASLLSGRTDQNASISQWLLNGYRDIAHTIPFETLEDTQDPYPCVANFPTLDYPSNARAIKSITLGFPASTPTSERPLYKRNKAIINRYASTPTGVPSIWAPYAYQIHLRMVPDDAYPLIVDFWRKVIPDPEDINNTLIEVPDDWLEIVEYAAQERGWIDLQEYEKANAVHVFLWGDPKMGKKNPGLVKQRLTRIQAEYENANYGMRPRLARYGAGMR
jgi:hypothetical protein